MSNRKHYVDENYFMTLDTPTKAYLFGILWADGSISKRKEKPIALRLEIKDEEILQIIEKEIGGSRFDRIRIDKRFEKEEYLSKLWVASSIELCQNLIDLDFRNSIKNVPVEYRHYFLRGLSDGDGCLYYFESESLYQFTIVSDKDQDWSFVLECFSESLKSFFSIQRNKRYSSLRVCGKKSLLILDYIYQDNEFLSLKRKQDLYYKISNKFRVNNRFSFEKWEEKCLKI